MHLFLLATLLLQINNLSAFVVIRPTSFSDGYSTTSVFASDSNSAFTPDESKKNTVSSRNTISPTELISNILKTSFLAACVWTTSSLMMTPMQQYPTAFVANAKEMASGSGSRVNKDPESLLRYGLPIPNDKPVRELQSAIEEIKINIASKRKLAALDNIKKTRQILNSQSTLFTNKMCRDSDTCTTIIKSMSETLTPLENALKDASNFLQGSDQERNALDTAYTYQDTLQKSLSLLEENMVPANYKTIVPSEYSDLPQLQGRATVEFILQKSDGSPYVLDGKDYNEAKLVMIIDGYTAPITSGNFIDLVQKGFYNKMNIQRSDGFVVQTGDPDGDAVGYVGKPSKAVGAGKNGERLIPLKFSLVEIQHHFMNRPSMKVIKVDRLLSYPFQVMVPWAGLEKNMIITQVAVNSFGSYLIQILHLRGKICWMVVILALDTLLRVLTSFVTLKKEMLLYRRKF